MQQLGIASHVRNLKFKITWGKGKSLTWLQITVVLALAVTDAEAARLPARSKCAGLGARGRAARVCAGVCGVSSCPAGCDAQDVGLRDNRAVHLALEQAHHILQRLRLHRQAGLMTCQEKRMRQTDVLQWDVTKPLHIPLATKALHLDSIVSCSTSQAKHQASLLVVETRLGIKPHCAEVLLLLEKQCP